MKMIGLIESRYSATQAKYAINLNPLLGLPHASIQVAWNGGLAYFKRVIDSSQYFFKKKGLHLAERRTKRCFDFLFQLSAWEVLRCYLVFYAWKQRLKRQFPLSAFLSWRKPDFLKLRKIYAVHEPLSATEVRPFLYEGYRLKALKAILVIFQALLSVWVFVYQLVICKLKGWNPKRQPIHSWTGCLLSFT